MKFYFVRHGETDWNVAKKIQGQTDIPLNQNGENQADTLAHKLAEEKINIVRVYSSKQKRAAKTAQIISDYLEVECKTLDGLEEMKMGLWEGRCWTEIIQNDREWYQKWVANRRYQHAPNGECYQDVVDRVLVPLKAIYQRETEDVLIVTHSAVIVAFLCSFYKMNYDQVVEKFGIGNASIIEIEADDIAF